MIQKASHQSKENIPFFKIKNVISWIQNLNFYWQKIHIHIKFFPIVFGKSVLTFGMVSQCMQVTFPSNLFSISYSGNNSKISTQR